MIAVSRRIKDQEVLKKSSVATGFDHSVANMYLIPSGLLVKHFAPPARWASIGTTPDAFPALTIGNVIGGGVLVGVVYWFVYLRKRATPPR
jgi:formate transporter